VFDLMPLDQASEEALHAHGTPQGVAAGAAG
jgi:hypothetical protein